MSDARLRELEQRWRTTGDLADEVPYLRERLRRDLLPRARLVLAGFLGSPVAREVLGEEGFPEEPSLGEWIRGLGRGRVGEHPELAREALVRATRASLELVLQQTNAEDPLQAELIPAFRLAEVVNAISATESLTELASRVAVVADSASRAVGGDLEAVRQAIQTALVPWALEYE